MSWRSKKLLASAEGRSCIRCGSVGTTVACHANSVALGKGTGIKADDCSVAELCFSCHNTYDGRTGTLSKDEKELLWLRAHARTVQRWFREGVVIVA